MVSVCQLKWLASSVRVDQLLLRHILHVLWASDPSVECTLLIRTDFIFVAASRQNWKWRSVWFTQGHCSLFASQETWNNQCTQNSENKEHIDVLLFDQQPVLVGNIPIISEFAPFFAPTARHISPQVCGQHHEIWINSWRCKPFKLCKRLYRPCWCPFSRPSPLTWYGRYGVSVVILLTIIHSYKYATNMLQVLIGDIRIRYVPKTVGAWI